MIYTQVLLTVLVIMAGWILLRTKTIMDNTAKTQQAIDELTTTVADETTVIESAVTLIGGFAQRLADAIASASNAGATDAQLSSLSDLKTAMVTEKQRLADAVVANTPAAPTA